MSLFATLRAPAGSFLREARARRLPARVARLLERSAAEICPQQPTRILESRELFERAAMHAAAGKGGNLELSFRTVDALATSVETLGLARSSDVPDPFRRVWVQGVGTRRPGVVLACGDGEVAVLCPPARGVLPEAGSVLKLGYRGFSSTVEYELRLDDPVRLPRGQILNLTRTDGRGAIGRVHERFPVYLRARVQRREPGAAGFERVPCEILDFSASGVRMECNESFATGDALSLEIELPDGGEPLATPAAVRWARAGSAGQHSHGLLFTDLSKPARERLDRFMATLHPD